MKSLREMGSGAEYIWPGGEQRWSGLAPVLLPIVGGLAVQYDVKNTRPDPLYFSIGSHPALRVPFAGGYLDNYYLRLGLFDQGVLIFKNLRSRVVSIRNSRNARAVSISTGGVPFMDVWAKPGRCPFLCLEPWSGLLDSPSATGELSQKEGILRLELGGEFTSTYRIEIA